MLAVDLDYGQPLAILGLKRGVAGNVDLFQLERLVRGHRDQRLAGALAQVAAGRVIEDDLRYG